MPHPRVQGNKEGGQEAGERLARTYPFDLELQLMRGPFTVFGIFNAPMHRPEV